MGTGNRDRNEAIEHVLIFKGCQKVIFEIKVMVFNYSSEWANAILHVKFNGIECNNFSFLLSSNSLYLGNSSWLTISMAKKYVGDLLCDKNRPSQNFHGSLKSSNLNSRNSKWEIDIAMTALLVTPRYQWDSWQLWHIIMSFRACFPNERHFDMKWLIYS